MEGPPLRAIAEEFARFKGRKILNASGNSKIEKARLQSQEIQEVFSWGKNLFLQFPHFSLKTHFLMFGSYRIDEERRGVVPRLSLAFSQGTLNFYNCSIKLLSNAEVTELRDEEIDIMSEKWNITKVLGLMSHMNEARICDVLLDQNCFAGVGNIIKNEALFRSQVHPLSIVERIPRDKLEEIATAARDFSLLFYETAKRGKSLRQHLKIYGKRTCPDCQGRVTIQKTGNSNRTSYFCEHSQNLYA